MNSRDRVLAAINHECLDRVPMDIWATPEVWEEVRRCIDMLASNQQTIRLYILAPCHNIQPITPIENIIAMYDEA